MIREYSYTFRLEPEKLGTGGVQHMSDDTLVVNIKNSGKRHKLRLVYLYVSTLSLENEE